MDEQMFREKVLALINEVGDSVELMSNEDFYARVAELVGKCVLPHVRKLEPRDRRPNFVDYRGGY